METVDYAKTKAYLNNPAPHDMQLTAPMLLLYSTQNKHI